MGTELTNQIKSTLNMMSYAILNFKSDGSSNSNWHNTIIENQFKIKITKQIIIGMVCETTTDGINLWKNFSAIIQTLCVMKFECTVMAAIASGHNETQRTRHDSCNGTGALRPVSYMCHCSGMGLAYTDLSPFDISYPWIRLHMSNWTPTQG